MVRRQMFSKYINARYHLGEAVAFFLFTNVSKSGNRSYIY